MRPPPARRTARGATVLAAVLCLVLTLGGCGTGVVEDTYEVSVSDPSGRVGPPPVEVGVFDSAMGQGREWAARTQRTSSPGSPYVGTVSSTVTRLVLDSSLPASVQAGVSLPGYAPDGWFALQAPATPGVEQRLSLPYLPYGVPGTDRPAPLPAVLTVVEGDRGWLVRLVLQVPSR